MAACDFSFREATPHDFQGIESLYEAGTRKRIGWAEWKYARNPDGEAQVFVAKDETGAVVGSLAHVPRRFTSARTGSFTVLQVVDIFVRDDLRRSAVFLGLLQYARERVTGPRIGLPNRLSAVFGAGLGWRPIGLYDEWQFPVLVGQSWAGRRSGLLVKTANALSRLYQAFWLVRGSRIRMTPVARFADDFDLGEDVLHGVRSAAYLNWRFIDNPITKFHAYEFRAPDNEVIGYCAFVVAGSSAVIYDFVAQHDPRGCLRSLVRQAREMKIALLRFSGIGIDLRSIGFVRRNPHRRQFLAFQAPEGDWLVTSCDLDSELGSSA